MWEGEGCELGANPPELKHNLLKQHSTSPSRLPASVVRNVYHEHCRRSRCQSPACIQEREEEEKDLGDYANGSTAAVY